jgi:hypothetical protein
LTGKAGGSWPSLKLLCLSLSLSLSLSLACTAPVIPKAQQRRSSCRRSGRRSSSITSSAAMRRQCLACCPQVRCVPIGRNHCCTRGTPERLVLCLTRVSHL